MASSEMREVDGAGRAGAVLGRDRGAAGGSVRAVLIEIGDAAAWGGAAGATGATGAAWTAGGGATGGAAARGGATWGAAAGGGATASIDPTSPETSTFAAVGSSWIEGG